MTIGNNEMTKAPTVNAPQYASGYTASAYQRCYHGGHKTLWTMPNGHGVYAAQEAELGVCTGHALVLDCTGYANKQSPAQRDAARAKLAAETLVYEGSEYLTAALAGHMQKQTPRLHVAWPDGGEPPLAPSFWQAFLANVQGSVVVCCHGSHGRTGTALASMYMAQHGGDSSADLTLAEVVATIRRRHCNDAVETLDQIAYLETVADYYHVVIDDAVIEPSYSYRPATPLTPKAGTQLPLGPSDVLGATRAVVNGTDAATGIKVSTACHASGERAKQANGNRKAGKARKAGK